ncbi:MAG: aminotransferase class III-fold pyridoxal phosphate-dependent enzyme [Deltaproteobacteria bacterium]|jgi:L-lysine 6-transaminase|nr:aminotransferase class III-fold pyridoxal phosphate-dependent enzyme [Deltaproteobacteria bacterium]MBT6435084.1 aminotransferase class III-fold pyridoxal phosphate-dependent enzyme [Deltaproteobacteria bacterium]MBT6492270.1 aminotransferase class III-fold pyridoxal phosphate-dependent enzyme [Deltaproteobacteria bacterium]
MAVQLDGPSAHAIECKIPGTNIEICLDLPRSRGAWFCESKTGDDYLDLTGLFGERALGFNHRGLVERHKAPTSSLEPSSSEMLSQLSQRMLQSAMTDGFTGLRLFDSGDTALAYALGLASKWRGKNAQIIHFSGNRNAAQHPAMLEEGLACPSLPSAYDAETQELNVEEAEALRSLEQAIRDADSCVAALIVESVQSSRGDHYLRPEFFQALRRLCDSTQALLIVDEVDSGFGRSGCWWDCQHLGAKPDMIIFGGIAELGGVLLAQELLELLPDSESVPDQMQWSRCNAILDAMENEQLMGHAGLMGRYLDTILTELAIKFPAVSNARSRGLRGAFDLPSAGERDALIRACLEEYLILLPSGVRSVSLRPTLDVRPDAIGRGIAQLEAALIRVYG